MTEQLLTEPLSVREFAVLAGVSWKTARSMLKHISGVIQVGSLYQIPTERMPATWHQVRAMGNLGTGLEISTSDLPSLAHRCKQDGMQLLNERDMAIALRISLVDLNALVESGSIPFVAVGGEVRFEPEKVLAVIQGAAAVYAEETSCKTSLTIIPRRC